LKDRTPWLEALKQHVKRKIIEAHKKAARASGKPANESSETLAQHTDKTDRGPVCPLGFIFQSIPEFFLLTIHVLNRTCFR
jgi:hypothetical protein